MLRIKRKGHLKLSDNLLAPAQSDCITKRMDRDIKFAFFQFIRSANRKIWLHHIFTIVMTYIPVKTVTTVVTTTVLDSTICVYTSVVPVNMLQVYTQRCYYWSWYLARRGRQQISTTTRYKIESYVYNGGPIESRTKMMQVPAFARVSRFLCLCLFYLMWIPIRF